MQNLILNNKTRANLEAYLGRPTHALLLTGQVGVGLGTIARHLARNIAGANNAILAPKLHDTQKTANINVADIKTIQEMTRGRRSSPLAIVIDEVDKMTDKAPEAFLKALEEPGEHIHFILTTHTPEKLPKTILSRVQRIEVLPAAKADCSPWLKGIKNPTKRSQIEFLALGRPAEIHRLSIDDDYFHNRARQVEVAKNFIRANNYQRLQQVSAIKTRDEAVAFVEALAGLLVIIAEKQPATNLVLVSNIIDNLYQNGNVKAQLTYLATNML